MASLDRKLKSMLLNYCHNVMTSIAPTGGRMLDISTTMMATKTMVYTLVLLTMYSSLLASAQPTLLTPMNCSSSATKITSCKSYLFYINYRSQTLSDIATNFNVNAFTDILDPPNQYLGNPTYLISKTCDCNGDPSTTTATYFANVSYHDLSPGADTTLSASNISSLYYGGLVYLPALLSNQENTSNGPIGLQLLCGCPIMNWATIVTYVVQENDTVDQVSSSLNSDAQAIRNLNNLDSMDSIYANQNLFIPINFNPSASSPSGKRHNGLIVGVISGVVVLLVLVMITACVYWWKRLKNRGVYSRSIMEHSGASLSTSSKGQSGRLGFIGNWFNSHRAKSCGVNNNVKRRITLPREAMDVFDQEKPIIFAYEEIIEATDNFIETRKLGQGAYGAVYSGILRQQNVAIKQMKTTKSREFYAELKVLCKVHHTNLVELLGYSAGDDSLFLIYEFAENGALSHHLHHTEGLPEDTPPLTWTARVQIALDTARGLEYIHDHTKEHYVHRDVKTSNILLDGFFRAKIADFGLAKLVEQNSETFVSSNRFVGTFGYMPPDYIQGGHTTSKSDVYAFGVVLFELITGRQAMSRTGSGRRSIISFMLDVLKVSEYDPRLRFQNVVDPSLGDCFPLEWSFKMAKLARACVDEEPAKRPDMRTVVFSLSQFLLNSVEWEAALAGSSQIFSGLKEGR